MDMAGVFEWFAQESWAAAELTHEQPQREIWLRLALMWALAALRSREEAEALGENAAVYLSGEAPSLTVSQILVSVPSGAAWAT